MNPATVTSMMFLIFSLVIAAGAEPLEKPSYELSLVEEQEELVPAVGTTVELRHIGEAFGRRRLAPFQKCDTCSCCKASDPGSCTNVPCCYAIKCNLPGKPPGTCALVPIACNCNNCK